MKPRKIYLDNMPLEEAQEKFFLHLNKVKDTFGKEEEIAVEESVGRVTAQPIWAEVSSPHYPASAMDGVVVKAEDTFGASETTPVALKLGEQVAFLDTGDPIPSQFNAVIMIEDIHQEGDQIIIHAPATPWQHVRAVGEDVVAAELILPQNHLIRPVDLGAILAGGVTEIKVWKKPKVFILPTGTELVAPREKNLKAGDIIESNSWVLGSLAKEWGAEFVRHQIVEDDYNKIKAAVEKGLESADIIVINAGSSAGSEDFTASIVEELGTLLVHGINTKPGKPVILGEAQGKPVVGIPGYPVSAVLTFNLFVKPLINKFLGLSLEEGPTLKAQISRKVVSHLGKEEFIQVKLGKVGEKIMATPISRGAGVTMSLVRSDGMIRIPASMEGIQGGQEIKVSLSRTPEEIENTIVAIGSHDLTIDLLANELKRTGAKTSLSSAHVGSLGGLMALKRGEAHLAGIHLLDEETGEYNLPYLKRLGLGQEVVLVNLVYREQGLMVAKGNPKQIHSLQDLTREDVIFLNRQKGAGTRILLDYELRKGDIDPGKIKGYEREEYTHMAVGVAVSSGLADVGLGILSAAKVLGLDFIPVAQERYDLAILSSYYESPLLQGLLKIISGKEFCSKVVCLGGYDVSRIGEILHSGK